MKTVGIVSYNIYGNFTNYGSALQTFALQTAINRLDGWSSIVIDYCPEILKDKDPLNPIQNMWDTDPTSRQMCEMSLPAIRVNYQKFLSFYEQYYQKTSQKYTFENFSSIKTDLQIDGYVCGSDTIFCTEEFGFDDGFFANYDCMKEHSISYAASFGDDCFEGEKLRQLFVKLENFKTILLRESTLISKIRAHVKVPVEEVLDPTLLLEEERYLQIAEKRLESDQYLLLYVRRYNRQMEAFAEKLARENGWKIIEISLRATNAQKHRMFYEAGVEEFLSLVKHAEHVVTNSFHGAIFSIIFQKEFHIFSREQCNIKINELLLKLGIKGRQMVSGQEEIVPIDYELVQRKLQIERRQSLQKLKAALETL